MSPNAKFMLIFLVVSDGLDRRFVLGARLINNGVKVIVIWARFHNSGQINIPFPFVD